MWDEVEALLVVLRLFAIIGGGLLCYAGAFLYEDEEQNLQNILEQWWVKLDDRRIHAMAVHAAFTAKSAAMLSRFLQRLFGRPLLSSQAITTSACLSFLSFYASVKLLASYGGELRIALAPQAASHLTEDIHATVFGFAGIFSMILAPQNPIVMDVVALVTLLAVALTFAGRFVVATAVASGIIAATLLLGYLTSRNTSPITGLPDVAALAVAIGVVCDVVALALTRQLIKWQAEARSFSRVAAAAITQLFLAFILLIGPPAYAVWLAMNSGLRPPGGFRIVVLVTNTRVAIFYSALSNAVAVVVALSLFVMLALVIAHRALWPTLQRPLYQLARAKLFRSSTTRAGVFALGVAVMGAAIGGGAVWDALLTLWK